MNKYQLAYAEGYDAYLAGIALISNPHTPWSEQSSGWNNGWNDAAKLNPPQTTETPNEKFSKPA